MIQKIDEKTWFNADYGELSDILSICLLFYLFYLYILKENSCASILRKRKMRQKHKTIVDA